MTTLVAAFQGMLLMKNELANDLGGFYSAYDANSEGVEGKYYRFTKDEILHILGIEDGNRFCHYTILVAKETLRALQL
jgi:uncharacterized protein YyaL (SSP411 family)